MIRRFMWILAAAALLVSVPSVARAGEVLKVGTLAPAESPWGQVFKVWQKGIKERTNGAVELQFFWNGQQGDEGAMVGKMRTGQLDGAAITATGLAQIYKHVLVLQMPGLFPTWEKLDTARNSMRKNFDAEFEKADFKILGWGDVGIAHMMTKGFEVRRPSDLKHKNTFHLAGDPIEPMVYSHIGDVTPTPLTVPEVLPALTSGKINVVNAPALAAEQLQWASRLDHINTAPSGIGIGALIFANGKGSKLVGLPEDARTALIETGKVAGDALTLRIRKEDGAAYGRLKARMTAYEPTDAEHAEWKALFHKTRQSLRGAHFKPEVHDEAERLAK